MRKLILAAVLSSIGASAMAHGGYGPRPHYHHHHGYNWVVPIVVGGAVGYAVARSYNPPPAPPIVEHRSICGPWIETQQPDGTILRQRTCSQ